MRQVIGSFKMPKENRNLYLRFVLNLLRNKYHVNLSALAKSSDFYPMNLSDFSRDARDFGIRNLDKLEWFLQDLYGGILEDEIPQDELDFNKFIKSL